MENSKNPILHEVHEFYRDVAYDVLDAFRIGLVAGMLATILALLVSIAYAIGALGVICYYTGRTLIKVLASVPGRVRGAYRDFLHRHFDNIGLLGGLAVVVATSYFLYKLDPSTPTLSLATVQVLFSAPLLLFMEVHTAIWCYKNLLPTQFKALLGQLGEKLNESVLPTIDDLLGKRNPNYAPTTEESLAVGRFIVQYHVTRFAIRCTRFVLYGIPFYLLFKAMEFNINLVLNMQPH